MKLLFLDDHVLTAGSVRMKGGEELSKIGETMTQVVIAQAKEFGTMYYSDRALSLWPAGAERDATRAVASMSAVVTAMSERVEAELHTQSMLLLLWRVRFASVESWQGPIPKWVSKALISLPLSLSD